eukprot:m.459857 g.459857  ORF g.459857 m.459857 type:complete len:601 (-) comp21585_c0_seq9:69-1871(-)
MCQVYQRKYVVSLTTILALQLHCTTGAEQFASASSGDDGEDPSDLRYARVSMSFMFPNGSTEQLHSISGVFSMYGVASDAEGIVVEASPLDLCSPMQRPASVPSSSNWIILARMDASSNCTALQQSWNAQVSGAKAVINMAPQLSSFIYLLELTASEAAAAAKAPSIPQVAVSGASGQKLRASARMYPGSTIQIVSPATQEEVTVVADLAVAIACMVVALIVLLYAFRVGRHLCQPTQLFMPPEESAEDIAERKARMEKVLENGIIPVGKYEPAPHVEDVCAICIDKLKAGDDVRTLLCNHVFHTECIDPWLYNKPLCPLCKDNVLERAEAVHEADDSNSCLPTKNASDKLSGHGGGNGNVIGLTEIDPITLRNGEQSDPLGSVAAPRAGMSAAELAALQTQPTNSLLHRMASDLDARMLQRSGPARHSTHSIYLPEICTSHMAPTISGSTLGPPAATHARDPSGGLSASSLASSAFAPDQRHGTEWRDEDDDTMLVPAMSEHDDEDADGRLHMRSMETDARDANGHTIIDIEGVNVFVNEECLRQVSQQRHGGHKRRAKKKQGRRRKQNDDMDIVTNETAFANMQRFPSVSSVSNTSVV